MNGKLLLWMALIVAVIGISQALVCTPNFCDSVRCEAVSREACEAGNKAKYEPNGGTCGCCALCVQLLDEGADCFSLLLRGVPASVACRDGLVCRADTHKCSYNDVQP